MNIEIQSVHFQTDQTLNEFVNDKVSYISTAFPNIRKCNVYLKNEPNQHITELKIQVPNDTLFVSGKGNCFEASTVDAVEKMQRRLETKFKDRTVHASINQFL